MDLNQPLDGDLNGLEITPEGRDYLQEMAKWGKFLAIMGFLLAGLMVIFGLFFGTFMASTMANLEELGGGTMFGGGLMTTIYLLGALFYFFPSLYLFKFSTKTLNAVKSSNTSELTEGLKNLKSNFKFWGIFVAIITTIYGLIFVFGMLGGLIGMVG